MRLILVDTNVLLVLIVGRTSPALLQSHKRTKDYDAVDYARLETSLELYDGVLTTPHVLTETSNLLRQVGNPARDHIQWKFRDFILGCREQPVASADGCLHEQFLALGLTDTTILVACGASIGGAGVDLLTADRPVYNHALSLGLPAELF